MRPAPARIPARNFILKRWTGKPDNPERGVRDSGGRRDRIQRAGKTTPCADLVAAKSLHLSGCALIVQVTSARRRRQLLELHLWTSAARFFRTLLRFGINGVFAFIGRILHVFGLLVARCMPIHASIRSSGSQSTKPSPGLPS